MPSWWMPLSCAKAFLPTMALLYCTGKPVIGRDHLGGARELRACTTSVSERHASRRASSAPCTHSSSAALPARSPMPLMAHSIWPAPSERRAGEFATARPRSLWQWIDQMTLSEFGMFSIRRRNSRHLGRVRIADRIGHVDDGRRRTRSQRRSPCRGNRTRCGWRPRPTIRRRRRTCGSA